METQEVVKKPSTMFAEDPAYDPATRTLTLTFIKGGTYTYADFSQEHFDEFIAAPSWGKWYHSHRAAFSNGVKQVPKDGADVEAAS